MKELIINQIAPIVSTSLIAILIIIIKAIRQPAIDLFISKKNEVEQRIIASGHEQELKEAKEVWNIIEEKFRITENASAVLNSKANEFDNLLLQRIPGLTQTNLDNLRQAIAGEVNKGKAVIVADDSSTQISILQQTNAQLVIDKANLQAKINQINSTLNNVQA